MKIVRQVSDRHACKNEKKIREKNLEINKGENSENRQT